MKEGENITNRFDSGCNYYFSSIASLMCKRFIQETVIKGRIVSTIFAIIFNDQMDKQEENIWAISWM